jgi:glycosyltransferase involved in cell wall biosynthesis
MKRLKVKINNKLYVDGLGIVEPHFSGVGQYILGILKGMNEINRNLVNSGKKPHDISVIIPSDAEERFLSFKLDYLKYTKFPASTGKMAALWHHNKLPPLDLYFGPGVYIFTRFVSMRLLYSKSIVIEYDLSFETHKQFVEDRNAKFLSSAVKRSIKDSDAIVTISKSVKKEIENFYKIKSKQVIVAYPAVDPILLHRKSSSEISEAKLKYGIEGDYILTLSNLEPRKNLESTIDAYLNIPVKEIKGVSLVIVGANGWKADKLFEKIENNKSKTHKIIRPKIYVEDEDKAAIISGATTLVYPSHYEGFGMPPLEALACGTPVIVSNNSSLPEAVGNLGLMIDSKDIKDLSKKMISIINYSSSDKARIGKLGPKFASEFSWTKSALSIIDLARST